jgi:hypothetical protein
MLRDQRRAVNQQARTFARGVADIDFALRGYNDDYWREREKLYADQLFGQLDRQADDAYAQAIKGLAARGLSSSSVADNVYGKLAAQMLAGRRRAASQAVSAVQGEKQSLEQQRAALVQALAGGQMGPLSVAQQASSLAQSAQAPAWLALGNMFAGVLQGIAPAVYAQARGIPVFGSLFGGRSYREVG